MRKLLTRATIMIMAVCMIGCGKAKTTDNASVESGGNNIVQAADNSHSKADAPTLQTGSNGIVGAAVSNKNKETAKTEVETQPSASTQKETVAPKVPSTTKETTASKAPSTPKETAPLVGSGSTDTSAYSWFNKSLNDFTDEDLNSLLVAPQEVIEKYRQKLTTEERGEFDLMYALLMISYEMSKDGMVYEVNGGNVANLVSFQEVKLKESYKKEKEEGKWGTIDNEKAWKNKAGNIVVVDTRNNKTAWSASAVVTKNNDGDDVFSITIKTADKTYKALKFTGRGHMTIFMREGMNSLGYEAYSSTSNLDHIVE